MRTIKTVKIDVFLLGSQPLIRLGDVGSALTFCSQGDNMKQKKLWIVAPLALVIGCLFTIGAWAGGYRSANNQLRPVQKVELANKTSSLSITKAEIAPNGRSVRVAVQNVTQKSIDWFRISLGSGSDIEADFAYADKPVLGPNESYEDSYPVQSKGDKLKITIVSVVFEDKSLDGDVRFAQRLMDKRLGQEIELRRLLPLINQALIVSGKEQGVGRIQALESKIGESPIDSNESPLPDAAQDGMKAVRERVLSEIRSVKASSGTQDQDVLQGLRKVAARYDRIGSKLKKYAR